MIPGENMEICCCTVLGALDDLLLAVLVVDFGWHSHPDAENICSVKLELQEETGV